jgi:hypothetical protein
MKKFEVNLLDLSNNHDYIHYEILIDNKRFISGWYKIEPYLLKYRASYNNYSGHTGLIENDRLKGLKRKNPNLIGIESRGCSYTYFITVEGCEIIKQKIEIMYQFLNA